MMGAKNNLHPVCAKIGLEAKQSPRERRHAVSRRRTQLGFRFSDFFRISTFALRISIAKDWEVKTMELLPDYSARLPVAIFASNSSRCLLSPLLQPPFEVPGFLMAALAWARWPLPAEAPLNAFTLWPSA
jgi:hypothetical protein